MDKLLSILKQVAPALAVALTGPMGGAVVGAIANAVGAPAQPDAIVAALEGNPDLSLKLKEIDVRQFEVEQVAVTDRWKADMASDSRLSKNIRPAVLIYILSAFLLFSLLSAFGISVNTAYVTLLGEWGQIVMLAYFGGRSAEKIASIWRR